jgi:bifunctional DNA-binding transcriptional regulator/antitoxin component of YhaV-PrlF toxin-antitoxin module
VSTIEAVTKLRAKNQLTLPEAIAARFGAEPGDKLIFRFDEDDPSEVHVRRVRRSYAGLLEGVYGSTPEEVEEYIRGERASWEE